MPRKPRLVPPLPDERRWQSRIVGYGNQDPATLVPNPENWRTHPERQEQAVGQLLGHVGWVQTVIVNRTTGHVVDGHLRAGLAVARGEETIPVAYVELSEADEKLALATFDAVTELGHGDQARLLTLLSDTHVGGELEALIRRTAGSGGRERANPTQASIEHRGAELSNLLRSHSEQDLVDIVCPGCGGEFAVRREEVDRATG